jgi:predicted O-methyltransferase YrrM
MELRWDSLALNRLTIGDTEFNVAGLLQARSGRRLVIRKNRKMIVAIADVIKDLAARNIVELGIDQGGSTALLAQLAQPKKLVAIDKNPTPVAALQEYISSHGLEDSVKVYYGVDQADTASLDKIIDIEFGDEPLDLVVDDASHLLHETRTSFNRLFPWLRRGGAYMIEDWGWGHPALEAMAAEQSEESREPWPSGLPLTVLVFQIVMTCASADGQIIDEITIDRAFVQVRRGPAVLDPSTFDVSRTFTEGPVKFLAPEVHRSQSAVRPE